MSKSLSFFWLAESVQWIFEISTCDGISADYTIIRSRSWVIMSSSHALFCSPSLEKQNYDFHFFVQCIIRQLLHSVFEISRIIKVSPRAITPTSTLISNSKWSDWSTIQGVIARVILKLDKHMADLKLGARLLPELYDTRSNY